MLVKKNAVKYASMKMIQLISGKGDDETELHTSWADCVCGHRTKCLYCSGFLALQLISSAYQMQTSNKHFALFCDSIAVQGVGDLNVLFLDNAGQTTRQWTLTGDQGDVWQQGQVDIRSDSDFQVRPVPRTIVWSWIGCEDIQPNPYNFSLFCRQCCFGESCAKQIYSSNWSFAEAQPNSKYPTRHLAGTTYSC